MQQVYTGMYMGVKMIACSILSKWVPLESMEQLLCMEQIIIPVTSFSDVIHSLVFLHVAIAKIKCVFFTLLSPVKTGICNSLSLHILSNKSNKIK